jgi:hypothetical protein
MANATVKTMKIFVMQASYVDINGVRTKYPQGLTDAPVDHANILINAGYATSAEPEKKQANNQ